MIILHIYAYVQITRPLKFKDATCTCTCSAARTSLEKKREKIDLRLRTRFTRSDSARISDIGRSQTEHVRRHRGNCQRSGDDIERWLLDFYEIGCDWRWSEGEGAPYSPSACTVLATSIFFLI